MRHSCDLATSPSLLVLLPHGQNSIEVITTTLVTAGIQWQLKQALFVDIVSESAGVPIPASESRL